MIKLHNRGVTLQGGVPTPAKPHFRPAGTRPWLIRSSAATTGHPATD